MSSTRQILTKIKKHVINLLPLKFVYNKKYFGQHLKEERLSDQKYIAELIYSRFKPKSIVDFGCGVGAYLFFFSKLGVNKIKGIEGSNEAIRLALVDKNFIEHRDLRKGMKTNENYDICICFEVAEHVNEKYAGRLLDSLCLSSDTIFFTAAPPGQGGRGHLNLKPYRYWIKKFEERGFKYEERLSEEFRKAISENISTISWMKRNLMIFGKVLTQERGGEE